MSEIKESVKVSIEVVIPNFVPELRHKIQVELSLEYNNGIHLTGTLPGEHTRDGHPIKIEGVGETLLGAVLAWLASVNRSMAYLPHYRKEEKR